MADNEQNEDTYAETRGSLLGDNSVKRYNSESMRRLAEAFTGKRQYGPGVADRPIPPSRYYTEDPDKLDRLSSASAAPVARASQPHSGEGVPLVVPTPVRPLTGAASPEVMQHNAELLAKYEQRSHVRGRATEMSDTLSDALITIARKTGLEINAESQQSILSRLVKEGMQEQSPFYLDMEEGRRALNIYSGMTYGHFFDDNQIKDQFKATALALEEENREASQIELLDTIGMPSRIGLFHKEDGTRIEMPIYDNPTPEQTNVLAQIAATAPGSAEAAILMSSVPEEIGQRASDAELVPREVTDYMGLGKIKNYRGTAYGRDYEGSTLSTTDYYLTQSSDGIWGVSPVDYQRRLANSWFEIIRKRQGYPSFLEMSDEERRQTKKIALQLADNDVRKLMMKKYGHVIVNKDPEGFTRKLAAGEIDPIPMVPLPQDILRLAGWDEAAETLNKIASPFTALLWPSTPSAPGRDAVYYGRAIEDINKESFLDWFGRAGLWTILGALYHTTEEGETTGDKIYNTITNWGSAEMLYEIRNKAYDPIEDVPAIGESIAGLVGAENTILAPIAGISLAVPAILLEPDIISVPTLGVGKVIGAASGAYDALRVYGLEREITRVSELLKTIDDAEELDLPMIEKLLDQVGEEHSRMFWPQVAARLTEIDGNTFVGKIISKQLQNHVSKIDNLRQGIVKGEERVKALEAKAREAESLHATTLLGQEKLRYEIERVTAEDLIAQEKLTLAKTRLELALGQKYAINYTIARPYTRGDRVVFHEAARGKRSTKAYVVEKAIQSKPAKKTKKKTTKAKPRMVQLEGLKSPVPITDIMHAPGARKGMVENLSNIVKKYTNKLQRREVITARIDELGYAAKTAKDLKKLIEKGEALAPVQRADLEEARELLKELENINKWLKKTDEHTLDPTARVAEPLIEDRVTSALLRTIIMKQDAIVENAIDTLSKARKDATQSATNLKDLQKNHRGVAGSYFETIADKDILKAPTDAKPKPTGTEAKALEDARKADELYYNTTLKVEAQKYRLRVLESVPDIIQDVGKAHVDMLREYADWRKGRRATDDLSYEARAFDLVRHDPELRVSFSAASSPTFLANQLARLVRRLGRVFDPARERFGEKSEDIMRITRGAAYRHEKGQEEAAMLFQAERWGDIKRYLTTTDEIEYGTFHKRQTYTNTRGTDKWTKTKQFIRNDSPDRLKANENLAVEGLARIYLPLFAEGAQTGSRTKQSYIDATRKIVLKAAEEDWGLQKLLDELNTFTFQTYRSVDEGQIAWTFATKAINHGSTMHDWLIDLGKSLGPSNDHRVHEAMNYIMNRGESGKPLTAEGTKDATNLIAGAFKNHVMWGLPFGSNSVTTVSHQLRDGERLHRNMIRISDYSNPDRVTHVPEDLLRGFTEQEAKFMKELEQNAKRDVMLIKAKNTAGDMLRWWRTSVVLGTVIPRGANWSNMGVGDYGQLWTEVGAVKATKLMINNAASYAPFIGPQLQKHAGDMALKFRDKPVLGTITNALFDPHLAKVLGRSRTDGVQVKEGFKSYYDLYDEMVSRGIEEFLMTGDFRAAVQRTNAVRSKKYQFMGRRWMSQYQETWMSWAREVQTRQRMLTYLDARVNQQKTANVAEQLTKDALYDFSHGAARWELDTLHKISAFYVFWRNALRQGWGTLSEGYTTPSAEYLSRAMVGRTKIARVRQQVKITGAVPEWMEWDTDTERNLNDIQQLEEVRKRMRPWWVGDRPTGMASALPENTRDFFLRMSGREYTHEVGVTPAWTMIDSMHFYGLMTQMIAGLALINTGEYTYTEDGIDQIEDATLDFIGPGLKEIGEISLDYFRQEPRYMSEYGMPIRTGDQAVLGMLDKLSFGLFRPGEDENGRQYMSPATYLALRYMPIVGTELPGLAAAVRYNNPHSDDWRRQIMPFALRFGRHYTGINKPVPFNPDKEHDRNLKKIERDLIAREKELKKKARGYNW